MRDEIKFAGRCAGFLTSLLFAFACSPQADLSPPPEAETDKADAVHFHTNEGEAEPTVPDLVTVEAQGDGVYQITLNPEIPGRGTLALKGDPRVSWVSPGPPAEIILARDGVQRRYRLRIPKDVDRKQGAMVEQTIRDEQGEIILQQSIEIIPANGSTTPTGTIEDAIAADGKPIRISVPDDLPTPQLQEGAE